MSITIRGILDDKSAKDALTGCMPVEISAEQCQHFARLVEPFSFVTAYPAASSHDEELYGSSVENLVLGNLPFDIQLQAQLLLADAPGAFELLDVALMQDKAISLARDTDGIYRLRMTNYNDSVPCIDLRGHSLKQLRDSGRSSAAALAANDNREGAKTAAVA